MIIFTPLSSAAVYRYDGDHCTKRLLWPTYATDRKIKSWVRNFAGTGGGAVMSQTTDLRRRMAGIPEMAVSFTVCFSQFDNHRYHPLTDNGVAS